MNKEKIKLTIYLSILPLIFITTTLEIAIIVGIVYVLTALITKGIAMFLDKHIDGKLRVYSYLLIAATIISVLAIILDTYLSLDVMIGLYLGLLVFSLDFGFREKKEIKPIRELIITASGFLLIILIGLLREVLGTGMINMNNFNSMFVLFDSKYAIVFLQQASGGFILSGVVFGIINSIDWLKGDTKDVN